MYDMCVMVDVDGMQDMCDNAKDMYHIDALGLQMLGQASNMIHAHANAKASKDHDTACRIQPLQF